MKSSNDIKINQQIGQNLVERANAYHAGSVINILLEFFFLKQIYYSCCIFQ